MAVNRNCCYGRHLLRDIVIVVIVVEAHKDCVRSTTAWRTYASP